MHTSLNPVTSSVFQSETDRGGTKSHRVYSHKVPSKGLCRPACNWGALLTARIQNPLNGDSGGLQPTMRLFMVLLLPASTCPLAGGQ